MPDSLPTKTGRPSTGTVYQRKATGRWVAAIMFMGKRTTRIAKSRREAEQLLAEMRHEIPMPYRGTRGVPPRPSLRPRAREWTADLLRVARDQGWDDDQTASAIVAALAPKRLKHGVFGPCAYCGTWIANSVDHVLPLSRGGTDDPSNIVSACYDCNFDKKDRTPEEWRLSVGRFRD